MTPMQKGFLLAALSATGAFSEEVTFGQLVATAESVCTGLTAAVAENFNTLNTVLGLASDESTGVEAADVAGLVADYNIYILAPTDAAFTAALAELPADIFLAQSDVLAGVLKVHIAVALKNVRTRAFFSPIVFLG